MDPLLEQILAGIVIAALIGLWRMIPWRKLLKRIKPPSLPADPKDLSASISDPKESPHPEAQLEEP